MIRTKVQKGLHKEARADEEASDNATSATTSALRARCREEPIAPRPNSPSAPAGEVRAAERAGNSPEHQPGSE